jgi:hypothetical protein
MALPRLQASLLQRRDSSSFCPNCGVADKAKETS